MSRPRFFFTSAFRITCNPPATTIAQRTSSSPLRTISSYAFVEFRSTRDAEDAYNDMHGRNLDGHRLSIQWAKNPPSSVWRYDRRSRSPPQYRSSRDRSRSPRRRSDRDRDRDRDERPERPERDLRDGDRDRRRRTRSPVERRRSPTPERRVRDDRERGRDRDRARTPPPPEDIKREEDKSQTPPYDH